MTLVLDLKTSKIRSVECLLSDENAFCFRLQFPDLLKV
jgi:hypothetical protein